MWAKIKEIEENRTKDDEERNLLKTEDAWLRQQVEKEKELINMQHFNNDEKFLKIGSQEASKTNSPNESMDGGDPARKIFHKDSQRRIWKYSWLLISLIIYT